MRDQASVAQAKASDCDQAYLKATRNVYVADNNLKAFDTENPLQDHTVPDTVSARLELANARSMQDSSCVLAMSAVAVAERTAAEHNSNVAAYLSTFEKKYHYNPFDADQAEKRRRTAEVVDTARNLNRLPAPEGSPNEDSLRELNAFLLGKEITEFRNESIAAGTDDMFFFLDDLRQDYAKRWNGALSVEMLTSALHFENARLSAAGISVLDPTPLPAGFVPAGGGLPPPPPASAIVPPVPPRGGGSSYRWCPRATFPICSTDGVVIASSRWYSAPSSSATATAHSSWHSRG
jgi:hypothetical protein